MDRIIQSYMNDFLKSQQIVEKDISKQFELFATYSVLSQKYSDIFDLSDMVTGAGGDCGMDAVAILTNGMIVSTPEEIEDLIEINKSLIDVTFVFYTSKNVCNFFSQ